MFQLDLFVSTKRQLTETIQRVLEWKLNEQYWHHDITKFHSELNDNYLTLIGNEYENILQVILTPQLLESSPV